MNYSQIYNIKDPKEKLFAAMDRVAEINEIKLFRDLTDTEDLELRNLEVLKSQAYSDWKDPQ